VSQFLHFAGAPGPEHRFLGVTGALLQVAASGRGMVELAHRFYGTPDYRLVRTSFHEAGHGVAAQALGEAARITISSPASGLCVHWREDGRRSSKRSGRMVALAGPVAQELAGYGLWLPDVQLQQTLSFDLMSNSDRIHAGDFTPADVSSCAALIRSSWSAVIAVAAEACDTYLRSRS
jgi:hypothetical protein